MFIKRFKTEERSRSMENSRELCGLVIVNKEEGFLPKQGKFLPVSPYFPAEKTFKKAPGIHRRPFLVTVLRFAGQSPESVQMSPDSNHVPPGMRLPLQSPEEHPS